LALWQPVSADFKSGSPRQFKSQSGSDIADAALADDGRIFAVGRWVDDDGQAYGWTGFITTEGQNEKVALKRRQPDSQLPPLSDLPKSNDAFQIPVTKLFSVPGYFGRDLSTASVNLGFSLTNSRTVQISALSDTGDLDLVLLDRNKRPIAFSNFNGSATDLIVVALSPGDYTVSVFANAPSRSYEIRLAPHADFSIDGLLQLLTIPEAQRPVLSDTLRAAGYTSSPEPDIAFGSETLRSLAAAQSAAIVSQPIISASFDPVIVQALGKTR
jgi:hypothetical protein